MSQSIRHFLKDPLPEWHQKPLHLTIAEMENPHLVIAELFEHYHLPELRFVLKEWLDAAIKEDEVMEINFLTLHNMVLRVAEAAWVLNQNYKNTEDAEKHGE